MTDKRVVSAEDIPPWLANLIRTVAEWSEETDCNGDHEVNYGCDGCAWDAMYAAVPQPFKAAAEKARKADRG